MKNYEWHFYFIILLHYDQCHLWENNKGLSDILNLKNSWKRFYLWIIVNEWQILFYVIL